MNRKQTWDHQRMKYARDKTMEMKKYDPQVGDDYASYVNSLPAEILINGLGLALAQLRAAAKQQENDPHELLYQHVQGWLCQDVPQTPYPKSMDLLEAIMKYDRRRYEWAIQETLAWLNWHKKFVNAYLKIRKEEDEDDEISFSHLS